MDNTPNLANDTPLEGTNSPDLACILMMEKNSQMDIFMEYYLPIILFPYIEECPPSA